MRTFAKCGPGLAILLIAVVLAGCATPQQTGAAVGAGYGAAAGAVIGKNLPSAALGAIFGGIAGALIGEATAQRPAGPQAGPPPPGVTVTSPQPADPTKGIMINGTRWEVQVFIDASPDRTPTVLLRPNESLPVNLDVGPHRIVARAFVDTQFGKRPVGTFDQTLRVDARASGWSIRFIEQNF